MLPKHFFPDAGEIKYSVTSDFLDIGALFMITELRNHTFLKLNCKKGHKTMMSLGSKT
jgi:hypothetical protein